MTSKIKNFVQFYCPGLFFPEIINKEIDSWNVELAKEMANDIVECNNAKPHSFKFITKELVGTDWDQHENIIKSSGHYFMNGDILTYHDIVNRKHKSDEILISNMKMNNVTHIIEYNEKSYIFDPFTDVKL